MQNKLSDFDIAITGKHKCILGEGPVWDEENGLIYWVDITRGEIHEFSVDTKEQRTIYIPQMVGCIALCQDGNFIGGLERGIFFIDKKAGELKEIARPETHLPSNRFNDGKCDPSGRFWAGTMSLSEAPGAGSVYSLDRKFNISKKITHTTISNGMAWSADKKYFYFIDTPDRSVCCFDYDDSAGNISNRRTVVKFKQGDGFPDGMTIDQDGMLWIAHWDGWQVSRWNPRTGEKLLSIPLPVARVTSCTFGGNDLGDLYVTTASAGLSEEQNSEQPFAGSLFVIRNTGYKGVAADRFLGSI